MHYSVFAALVLVVMAGAAIAGCSQAAGPAAVTTPAPAVTALPTTAAPPTPLPSFTLGAHYLQKSYSFQSEKDTVSEQFRVDNPSWGIELKVLPLNDDPQYTWFEMTVTNMDTIRADTYGYGRTYPYETHQLIPMYVTGPYKVDMKGNRVKVDLTAAKRNP